MERAAVILGIELSKLENRESYGVSKTQTEKAIVHIEEAINLLSGGGFGAASTILDKAAQESYPDATEKLQLSSGDFWSAVDQLEGYEQFVKGINKTIGKEL